MSEEFNITFDGTKYEDSIICYLDILGYTSLMLSGEERHKDNILNLQRKLQFRSGELVGKEGNIRLVPNVAILSDTVIYSYPLKEISRQETLNSFEPVAWGIEHNISRLQLHLLQNGMLSRGSIVVGKIYNYNNKVFGEGLALASDCEKKAGDESVLYIEEDADNLPKETDNACFSSYFHQNENDCGASTKRFDFLNYFMQSWMGKDAQVEDFFSEIDKCFSGIEQGMRFAEKCENRVPATQKWKKIRSRLISIIEQKNSDIEFFFGETYPLKKLESL